MENYLLYGQMNCASAYKSTYKGRKKGTVIYCGLSKWKKTWKEHVTNEVKLLATLCHKNVIEFREWYETTQHIWVITELASGGSLAELLLQDGSMTLESLPAFVEDIVSGLNYLHSRNIVHCDLQPEKISLDSYSSLKLSDFTLAFKVGEKPPFTHPPQYTLTPSQESHFTSSYNSQSASGPAESISSHSLSSQSSLSPSLSYMAPECLRGEDFSQDSDLWSLGCIVFELCKGVRPFSGNSADIILHSISQPMPKLVSETGNPTHNFASKLINGLLQPCPLQRLTWEQLLLSLIQSSPSDCTSQV